MGEGLFYGLMLRNSEFVQLHRIVTVDFERFEVDID